MPTKFNNTLPCVSNDKPTQIHLSVTNDPTEMVVMWSTCLRERTMVEYALMDDKDVMRKRCKKSVTYNGWDKYMHTVKLAHLQTGSKYKYRVGNALSGRWSAWWWFETRPAANFDDAVVAIVGDFDKTEAAKKHLEKLVETIHEWDLLIIAGDLCYAKGQSSVWDMWGEIFEPLAAIRPLMVLPGNHENETKHGKGWDAYNLRYRMPSSNNKNGWKNQYYSFRFGNVHFTMVSTEDDLSPDSPQGLWLDSDLARASEAEDRPWIVLLTHKGIHCSADKKWMSKPSNAPALRQLLEPYLVRYSVSLMISGHIHCYERTTPIHGVTHVTVGTGGAKLDDHWVFPQPEWSANRLSKYGAVFLRMHAKALEVEFKGSSFGTSALASTDFDYETLDSVHLTRPL